MRLLVLSRCTREIFDIMASIKTSVTREICASETESEIEYYVKHEMEQSENLRIQFDRAGINPIDYFRKSANGNFLWVDLVLSFLERCDSMNEFTTGLYQIPSQFYELYRQVLHRIVATVNSHKKAMIDEIIRTVVTVNRELHLEELKTLVENGLQDQISHFSGLLRSECGTFLRVVTDPMDAKRNYVRVIHETFREFIISEDSAGENFHVSLPESHGHIGIVLLQYLTTTQFGTQ